jgi:hypothetical protein
MTVEQHDVVDFVAKDATTGTFFLVISDHLPWDETNEHLFCLQEKLNCYFGFIESGELAKKYPDTAGHKIAIDIALEHAPPDTAIWFFDKARDASEAAGLALTWRVLEL